MKTLYLVDTDVKGSFFLSDTPFRNPDNSINQDFYGTAIHLFLFWDKSLLKRELPSIGDQTHEFLSLLGRLDIELNTQDATLDLEDMKPLNLG